MKQSTKKAIAGIVAISFPAWIVVAIIALPLLLAAFIVGGIYDDVLRALNHGRAKDI